MSIQCQVKKGCFAVEPHSIDDSHAIAEYIQATPEQELREVFCGDGKQHNLFRVTPEQLTHLMASVNSSNFNVWRSKGADDPFILYWLGGMHVGA